MPRLTYDALLPAVRAWVDALLGSAVVEARTQAGGWSPSAAARVRCADGTRAFVKAVSSAVDPDTPGMHRAEARVLAALPAGVGAPRLRGTYDDGTWVALVLDDVEGREPTVPGDLAALLAAVDGLAAVQAPVGVPAVQDVLGEQFHGWRLLAAAPPADLDPWQARHLDALAALEQGWAGVAEGDGLLHLDLRTDNALVRPDGTVALVDWAWAAAGAPVLDVVLLAVPLALQGGGDPEELLQRTAAGREADPVAVDRLLAAFVGHLAERARQPPRPALPTVRAFQGAQAAVGSAWLRARTGWA